MASPDRAGRGQRPLAPETETAEAETVTQLPRQSLRLPLWLKLLVFAQQGSTVVAGGLMGAALMVYSWTVYVDKMVFRTSRQLEALQTETQQITTTNETLKHSKAKQAASSHSWLQFPQPNRAIFLAPAPLRPVDGLSEAPPPVSESPLPSGATGRSTSKVTPAKADADLPRPLGY